MHVSFFSVVLSLGCFRKMAFFWAIFCPPTVVNLTFALPQLTDTDLPRPSLREVSYVSQRNGQREVSFDETAFKTGSDGQLKSSQEYSEFLSQE